MYDRDTAMLEKYDLTVKTIRKVRGGWLCTAQEGLFLWKESHSGEERLNLEDRICMRAEEMGLSHIWNCAGGKNRLRMDIGVRNREGELLTEDERGRKFILKRWTEGEECDVKNVENLRESVRAAACMHQILRGIKEELAVQESYEILWNRRKKEISRVYSYVRKRRNKNVFEQMIMKETPYFLKQAQNALDLAVNFTAERERYICHGDFHYHNLVFGRQETWICQSSRFHFGDQITDLYLFLRKCMEKHSWNWQLARELLEFYQQICPVTKNDRQLLYCLFLFPEKYWKQLNFYLQSNKAWMPEKNVIKLQNFIRQEEDRQQFLEQMQNWKQLSEESK